MKLLNCTDCHDIVKLQHEWRKCVCGKAAGKYLKDGKSVSIQGSCRIIGIDSQEYKKTFQNVKFEGKWFVIPESNSKIFRKRD